MKDICWWHHQRRPLPLPCMSAQPIFHYSRNICKHSRRRETMIMWGCITSWHGHWALSDMVACLSLCAIELMPLGNCFNAVLMLMLLDVSLCEVKVFSLCKPWWWGWGWGMSEVTWVSSAAAAKVGAQCLEGSHQGNTACLVPSRIHLSTAKDTHRLPAVLYRDKEEGYIPAFQVALPSLDRVQNRPLCKTKKNHTLHPKVLNST